MEECNGSTHEIEVVDPCGLPQTLTGAIYLIGSSLRLSSCRLDTSLQRRGVQSAFHVQYFSVRWVTVDTVRGHGDATHWLIEVKHTMEECNEHTMEVKRAMEVKHTMEECNELR